MKNIILGQKFGVENNNLGKTCVDTVKPYLEIFKIYSKECVK